MQVGSNLPWGMNCILFFHMPPLCPRATSVYNPKANKCKLLPLIYLSYFSAGRPKSVQFLGQFLLTWAIVPSTQRQTAQEHTEDSHKIYKWNRGARKKGCGKTLSIFAFLFSSFSLLAAASEQSCCLRRNIFWYFMASVQLTPWKRRLQPATLNWPTMT